jgi:hypothetical protein
MTAVASRDDEGSRSGSEAGKGTVRLAPDDRDWQRKLSYAEGKLEHRRILHWSMDDVQVSPRLLQQDD